MNAGRRASCAAAALCRLPALAVLTVACSTSPGTDGQADVADVLLRLSIDRCNGVAHEGVLAARIGPDIAATVAHGFVDEDGKLDVEEIVAIDADGEVVEVRLAFLDVERDVALLAVTESESYLQLASAEALDDDGSVRIALVEEDSIVHREVALQNVGPISLDGIGERQALELSGTVAQGDSGAPVLTDDVRLLGIVFASGSGRKVTWAIAAPEYEAAMAQPGNVGDLSC